MRQVIRIAMGLWLAGAGGGSTKAETADSRELKAAFLFNFTRFVEWPPSAFASANAPFVICMVGGDDMKLTLVAVTRDKIAEGRALKVLRIGAGSARSCHIVFVSESARPEEVLAAVRTWPVLTVGESDGFTRRGGMINFLMQDRRIRLEIRPSAANSVGLKISSKLLQLATIIGEPSSP